MEEIRYALYFRLIIDIFSLSATKILGTQMKGQIVELFS
jgi:hypothetical protein